MRCVRAHERAVHLEAAPVRITRVRPRPLVALQAAPCTLVGRVVNPVSRMDRPATPLGENMEAVVQVARPQVQASGWRSSNAHQALPAPRRALVAADLADDHLALVEPRLGRLDDVFGRKTGCSNTEQSDRECSRAHELSTHEVSPPCAGAGSYAGTGPQYRVI